MAPRLRVLAGTSINNLVPITELVNTSRPFELSSDAFNGNVVVYIKGLAEADGNIRNSEYFEREDRSGITWSIQVQGQALILVHVMIQTLINSLSLHFRMLCCIIVTIHHRSIISN